MAGMSCKLKEAWNPAGRGIKSGLLCKGLVLRNPVLRCELSGPIKISALAHCRKRKEGERRGERERGEGRGEEGGEGEGRWEREGKSDGKFVGIY